MDNKVKAQLISLSSLVIILGGLLITKQNDSEERLNRIYYSKTIYSQYDKNNRFYLNDTVNIDDEIDKLNIKEERVLPYDTYKVLRYIDKRGNEKISIINTYVQYAMDNKDNVNKFYTFVDAFNGTVLLSTNNLDYNVMASDYVQTVLEYGDLLDLKKIMMEKGLDIDYANRVMYDDIKNSYLSTQEVAGMYVLLVSSNDRAEYVSGNAIILK